MKIEPLTNTQLQETADLLAAHDGNAAAAARASGISEYTLRSRRRRIVKRGCAASVLVENVSGSRPLKIMVIPDAQVKPGVNTDHLAAAGAYAAAKKPDVIVCIGDFADMESLSSYDLGKKSFEGRTYKADIAAAKAGMKRLVDPIRREREVSGWNPRMVLTLGNHEYRIERAIELDRKLEGTISLTDLEYAKFGWEVHPFLEPVLIEGVCFSHYFVTGTMGRAASTASAILSKKHQSVIAGHLQGRQVAYATRADGSQITVIIAGSFYSHQENYLGIQGNKHWRGLVMLHEVLDGSFDESFISLRFLLDWHKRNGG